jgi:hypothetical protein
VLHGHLDNLGQVQSSAMGAVLDLGSATAPVGDQQRVRRCLAHGITSWWPTGEFAVRTAGQCRGFLLADMEPDLILVRAQ